MDDTSKKRIPKIDEGTFLDLCRPEAAAWEKLGHGSIPEILDIDIETPLIVDPIGLALSDWESHRASPERSSRLRRPSHVHFLRRADSEPLGLARLVVESARHRAHRNPQAGLELMRRVHRRLEALNPGRVCADRWRQVEGRCLVALAEEHLQRRDPRRAGALLLQAERLDDSADLEGTATRLEAQADLLVARRRIFAARERLISAREALEQVEMPGRVAETHLALAALHFPNEARLAIPHLQRALEALPEGRADRLRLQALHYLATAWIDAEDYERASDFLYQAAPFYSHDLDSERFVEHLWMQARIAGWRGELDDEERLLFQVLAKTHLRSDLISTLFALIENREKQEEKSVYELLSDPLVRRKISETNAREVLEEIQQKANEADCPVVH